MKQQVRVGKIYLQKFYFRGSLVSKRLEPSMFNHSVQRPSSTEQGTWREVELQRGEEEVGMKLWLRAVIQPWTNLKVKVKKIFEHDSWKFPSHNLLNIIIPNLPSPPEMSRTFCFVCFALIKLGGEASLKVKNITLFFELMRDVFNKKVEKSVTNVRLGGGCHVKGFTFF